MKIYRVIEKKDTTSKGEMIDSYDLLEDAIECLAKHASENKSVYSMATSSPRIATLSSCAGLTTPLTYYATDKSG